MRNIPHKLNESQVMAIRIFIDAFDDISPCGDVGKLRGLALNDVMWGLYYCGQVRRIQRKY